MTQEVTQQLSPKLIELLHLAQNGAVCAVQHLSENDIRVSFRLAELLDLPATETRQWPQHFDFDKPSLSAREIASAIREGYLTLPADPRWQAPCVGAEAIAAMHATEKTAELLNSHWPVFTYQPALGDDGWTANATVKVRRGWLVPGNIVHSSHGIRFQISRIDRAGVVTQIWAAQNDHSERYDSDGLIEVESSSLSAGQRYLTA